VQFQDTSIGSQIACRSTTDEPKQQTVQDNANGQRTKLIDHTNSEDVHFGLHCLQKMDLKVRKNFV
jgi:hypothetical protein